MAEVVEQYTFQQRAPWTKYPWDLWLDGRVWRVVEGVDTANIRSFRSYLYTVCSKRGLKVLTNYENLDDASKRNALVFRAIN